MSSPSPTSRGVLAPRAALQPDERAGHDRFVGAQVPGENPVHWIAERAPPAGC